MRNKIVALFLLGTVLLATSCAKLVAPPYCTVEKIVRINPGMTAAEVSSTLGIPPFDLYHMAGDGSTVHLYYYKVKERKNKGCSLFMKDFYSKEENLTVGNSYYSKEKKLYVLFQNGKVSSMVTESGRDDSEDLLIQNNTIQFIAKTNRHAINYEKLELGQQLIRLDNKGHFEKKKDDGLVGKAKLQKKGCAPGGGCMGK
jgi:hypothetical protein